MEQLKKNAGNGTSNGGIRSSYSSERHHTQCELGTPLQRVQHLPIHAHTAWDQNTHPRTTRQLTNKLTPMQPIKVIMVIMVVV